MYAAKKFPVQYSSILFAHSSDHLMRKIQAVETMAIKIAYRLAPWATNTYCYSLVTFPNILERIKTLSSTFIEHNKNDDLIQPLLDEVKPSMTGHHSVLYKALHF